MIRRKGYVRTFVLMIALYVAFFTATYAQSVDIESKQESIHRIEQLIESTESDSLLLRLYKDLFYIYVNDDLDKAIFNIQKSIQYALDSQKLEYVAISYSDFGYAYSQMGNFEKAFESFETARIYNENFHGKDRSYLIDFFMGRTWLELQVYDLAEDLLTNAEEAFLNPRNHWLAEYELTRLELAQGNTESVLNKLPLLRAAIPETDNQVNIDYLYHYLVLAELFVQVDQTTKAQQILTDIAPYVNKHNRNYYRGILNYTFALVEMKNQQFESAFGYATKAEEFFTVQKEFFYQMKTLKLLAEIQSKQENFEKAFDYLSKYNKRIEAVQEAQHNAISAHLKSDSHLRLETQGQLQLQESQIIAREIVIYILVALFFLLGIVTYIFYRSALEKKAIANQLANLNLDKNHFIGVVSHDLRSPLNSIMVLAEFMTDDPEMIDQDTAKEYGSIIFHSSQQMQHLLNNMLDVNKIESNQTNITPQPLDVLPILKNNYETTSILGKSKGIHTILDTPESLPKIQGTENAITRVLENLISNAYKFSPMDSTVTIRAQEIGSQVEISITDQGPGLTELDKTKLFKKFEKLSASPTGNEKSTGLGLYIVKNLVHQMNGTILIESEQGKGTTFKVLLNKV